MVGVFGRNGRLAGLVVSGKLQPLEYSLAESSLERIPSTVGQTTWLAYWVRAKASTLFPRVAMRCFMHRQ